MNNVLRTRKREKYEYSGPFTANVAFCNLYLVPACSEVHVGRYANSAECVGYHADQLTYLGPHPTIASISLGCEREVPSKS